MNSPSALPPHLIETPWLEFEHERAVVFCDGLSRELLQLSEKLSAKRVHDARVALRRWTAIWAVLKEDGWETPKYHKKIGKKLRKLRKLLGSLRDLDVGLQMGRELGLSQRLLQTWADARGQARSLVKDEINNLNVKKLVVRMDKYLQKRIEQLRLEIADASLVSEPAYDHLNRYLTEHERLVKKLEPQAHSAGDLHKLRLEVKRWRYLLTEFFGLTNLQLVKTQQYLGKLNDYYRLELMMQGHNEPVAQARVKTEMERLHTEFNKIRKDLPYGLRPMAVSLMLQE